MELFNLIIVPSIVMMCNGKWKACVCHLSWPREHDTPTFNQQSSVSKLSLSHSLPLIAWWVCKLNRQSGTGAANNQVYFYLSRSAQNDCISKLHEISSLTWGENTYWVELNLKVTKASSEWCICTMLKGTQRLSILTFTHWKIHWTENILRYLHEATLREIYALWCVMVEKTTMFWYLLLLNDSQLDYRLYYAI